jgi:predicted negative regulator of RcsB-dependent stress response
MEIYSTEEQQVEAIKTFWKENGTQIIAGATIGLVGFGGWNWYQDKTIAEQEAASAQFQVFVEQAEQEGTDAEQLNASLSQFISQYGESGYSVFVNLIAAKKAIDEGQFETAMTRLQDGLASAEQDGLKDLLRTRIARVAIELGQFDNALAQLNAIASESYQARAEELKGDVYLAQGDQEQARSHYQQAADKGALTNNPVLEMKLNDLAVAEPVVNQG